MRRTTIIPAMLLVLAISVQTVPQDQSKNNFERQAVEPSTTSRLNQITLPVRKVSINKVLVDPVDKTSVGEEKKGENSSITTEEAMGAATGLDQATDGHQDIQNGSESATSAAEIVGYSGNEVTSQASGSKGIDEVEDQEFEEPAIRRPLIMREPGGPDIKPNEVVFFSKASGAALDRILASTGWTLIESEPVESLGLRMVVVSLPKGETVAGAITTLGKYKAVEWAQPNHIYWLLGNSRTRGIALHGSRLGNAGPVSGTIAMIDSPVDLKNPHLAGARISEYRFGKAANPAGHGTAIAEILVGTGKFGGVAKGARLVSLAAFAPVAVDGWQSETRYLVKALDRAIDIRPHVLNLSFGTRKKDRSVARLIAKLDEGGTCLAAAVGNVPKASVRFPGNLPQTLAITAIDDSRSVYVNASHGDEVDVAAWGVGMSAAVPGGRRVVSGTSFATAIVSGAMLHMPACSIARQPDAMRKAVKRDALDLGNSDIFGAGLFQLGAASLANVPRQADGNEASMQPQVYGTNSASQIVIIVTAIAGLSVLFALIFAWKCRQKDTPQ